MGSVTIDKIKRNLNRNGLTRLFHLFPRKSFKFFEKYFRLHITPVHFYSPIPTVHELSSNVFEKVFDCKGIDWNMDEQFEYLRRIFPKYAREFDPLPNTGLSLVDAFILYAMVREKKPAKMIEIGAGDTTKISLKALKMNKDEGFPYRFYSIEPYPRKDLKQIEQEGFELIDKKVQDVDIKLLSSVDILFIDSSHVSKINSDVNYEILEIIPHLEIGSVVHWHDILIPNNYWKDWINHGNMFWNESYMLHAFLLFNESFKVIWASRYMQLNHFDDLSNEFKYLNRDHRLTSFWIERVK